MDKTENLELNKWESTDRILMEDFNNDNAKIDTALTEQNATLQEHAATLAQHAELLPKLGNCQLHVIRYSGTGKSGESNPNTLTFPYPPTVVLLFGPTGWMMICPDSYIATSILNGSNLACQVIPGGNTVSWYSTANEIQQFNQRGYTYMAVGLLPLS